MTQKLASLALALILTILAVTYADARTRHHSRHSSGESLTAVLALLRRQNDEVAQLRQELAAIRRDLRPGAVVEKSEDRPTTARNPVVASLETLPTEPPSAKPIAPAVHVFPATAVQRGQFKDQRRTHRHAGIDLAGAYGSPIVASFAGRILPAPGGDRGYGPHVIVIKGDDGIVYRYAHLSSVAVRVGQYVETGARIGGMGHVGRHGRDHLHFEMIPYAEYRRRPYGTHSLNPNDYLGGGRGERMVAGIPMVGQAAHRYAVAR